MVEIGGKPILWHIMKIYSAYGFNDFVICLGYKGYLIKEYFANYYRHEADITIDLSNNTTEYHNSKAEPWRITLVDTGHDTMTGGRIKRIQQYIKDEPFMLTYGDGVGNINIHELIKTHKEHKKHLTVTAVQPSGRFGALQIAKDDTTITAFEEKPKGDGSWINGGFFVCEPQIFNYLNDNPLLIWEKDPMEAIAKAQQMTAYKHEGFWKPMDTLRDKQELEKDWANNHAQWKIWQ